MIYLRNLLLVSMLLGASLVSMAQKPHFVYLQTETQEPFYVQLNKKNQSSSAVGHVVLAGLVNGTYDILVGFPGQNQTQEYRLVLDGTDKGYLVKKFEKGEWGLVDLQTSSVQLAGAVKKEAEKAELEAAIAAANAKKLEEEQAQKAAQAKADSAKEAGRLQDSTKAANQAAAVAAAAVVTENEVKKEGSGQAAGTEKRDEKTNDGGKVLAVGAAVVTTAAVAENIIKKEDSAQTAGNDKKEEKSGETVEKQSVTTGNPPVGGTNAGAATATVAVGTLSAAEIIKLQEEARRIDAQGKRDSVLKAQKKDTSKTISAAPAFLDMEMTMPADSLKPQGPTVVDSLKKAAPAVVAADSSKAIAAAPAKNPNCTAEATDADIEMVTMLIKGEKAADDGLEMARKGMKIKCVQTAQVRRLALLFEGQEDRYRLLDMAYRYTLDRQNYLSLADLLTDTYFLNRFKAMLQ